MPTLVPAFGAVRIHGCIDRSTPFQNEATMGPENSTTPQSQGWLAFSAVALAALIVVTLHVFAYTKLSPIDETPHVDYMEKVSHGELVGRGDRLGQYAMSEEACRGIDNDWPTPACNSAPFSPDEFAGAGFNTAYTASPLYYGLTGFPARLLDAVLPQTDSLVTAGRWLGSLWLIAGLWVTWLLLGEFHVSLTPRLVSTALIVTLPTVIHASATINPDASALLAGAVVLLVSVRYERSAGRAWLVPLVAFLAVAAKPINSVGVGVAILYAVVRIVQSTRNPNDAAADSSRPRMIRLIALLLLGTVGSTAAWGLGMAALSHAPTSSIPMAQWFTVDAIGFDDVVGQLGAAVTPVSNPYLPYILAGTVTIVLAAVANWLLLSTSLGQMFLAPSGSRSAALATAVVIAMVATGPFFVLTNFYLQGIFVAIPARYGLSALAALTVLLGLSLNKKPVLALVTILSIAQLTWVIGRLARLF